MKSPKAISLFFATAGLIALGASGHAQAPGEAQPPRGPLAPDTSVAKGYNDAARALADVDDNPVIDWAYSIWCVNGYGSIGPNDNPDTLPPAEVESGEFTDYMSPRGFSYTRFARPMPAAGAKFLDNAWYFGTDHTGAIVVQTDDGLILYDALTTVEDAETQLIAPMLAAGLDPADIKYIFMGHGHGDHMGGANLIRERYAPDVKFVMGQPDAAGVAARRAQVLNGSAPTRPGEEPRQLTEEEQASMLQVLPDPVDIQIPAASDTPWGAQRIQMGNTEIMAILQPGHTVGQMSIIVPVTYKGQQHKMLLWSGNDSPQNAALYGASADWVKAIAYMEGADVFANSHAYQGATFYHIRRQAADPNYNNPMVMGVDGLQRYLGIFSNCQRAWVERSKSGTWERF